MNHLEEINQLHSDWQALQPLKPEDDKRLWKKLRLEWNYHSNHIEGNTLTYGETATLLIHDQAVGNHDLRNYVEMKAHDLAIEHLRSMVKEDRPLAETDIRDLNRILLKEPFWKEAITAEGQPSRIEIIPGQYKQQPNNVRTADGGIFKFAAPEEVPTRIAKMIEVFRQALEKGTTHPVEIASMLHHEFVLIHPFGDGNGRTARLLVNYILMRAGYPPIIVPSPEKDHYLAALRQADAGDLQPLTDYLAACTTRALERGILAGKGESIEEPDDLDKEIEIFKKRQSNESKEVKIRSENTIRELYAGTIKPMFDEFVAKHKKLAELFVETEIAATGIAAGDRGEPWHNSIARFLTGPHVHAVNKIGVRFAFKGYKSSADKPFNINTYIGVTFSEFQYVIEYPNMSLPPRYYNDSLSPDVANNIVKTILAETFNRIKKQSAAE